MVAVKRPNILFFFPDQHRPDWGPWNANLPLRLPNLQALTERGTRFTRAFTPSPLCAPARAALASGMDYGRTVVLSNKQDYPLDCPTFYQSLREVGYHVLGVGKFDLHKGTLDWNLDGSRLLQAWGFTGGIDNEGKLDGSGSYHRYGGPRGPYLNYLNAHGLADIYCQEHRTRDQHRDAYTTALPEHAYCDNWLSANGLRILREVPEGEPWFLQINFTGPHNPMDVTAAMRERWKAVPFPAPHKNRQPEFSEEDHQRNRQNYAAMLENIDRQVGRFLELVRERGEEDRTLIVYSSDHGEMLGDHSRWGKSTWHAPSVGIPLVMAGPDVPAGQTSDALVALHDLCATFLETSEAPALPAMDAQSLWPVLARAASSHRDFVISGLGDWRTIYDGRYKAITRRGQADQLYDLMNDPWEDHDLATLKPDVLQALAMRLREAAKTNA